jgi:PAS domain-containing protein
MGDLAGADGPHPRLAFGGHAGLILSWDCQAQAGDATPWSTRSGASSATSCALGAAASRPRASGFTDTDGGAHRACGARKWPNSPASASTGTSAWSRAARSHLRSPPSTPSRALRLTEPEHQHLRALAGGGGHRPFQPEVAPPTLLRLLESLTQPAYVTGRRRDLVAWNAAADDIFGFEALAEDERNILVSMLTIPRSRDLFGPGWAAEAQRMVAQFRATHDLWAGDPAFVALLKRLRDGCPEFDAWWERHDVRRPVSGVKTLRHPTRGVIAFEHASFQANDDPGLKLVIYTPVPA